MTKEDLHLPSKYGEDEAAAERDVTESVGQSAQTQYVADRKKHAEERYGHIQRQFELNLLSAKQNWLLEAQERLKQCLYDSDFDSVADQLLKDARCIAIAPDWRSKEL